MERILTYITAAPYIGKPIKTVLQNHFCLSAGMITRLKQTENGICVNNIPRRVRFVLDEGDVLTLRIREDGSETIIPVEGLLDILYEDEDFLILNKPPGLPVHPSPGHYEDTLANRVLYYLNRQGVPHTFHGVNRLDRNTSGLVVTAKHGCAHSMLMEQMKRRQMKKTYQCIVTGKLEGSGEITAPIGREPGSIIKRRVTPEGQYAKTNYRVLHPGETYSLLEVEIETGRTHQIRVHFSHLGHPLAGDTLYGTDETAPRHMLHCGFLSFLHPITHEKIELFQEIPLDMVNFLRKFA